MPKKKHSAQPGTLPGDKVILDYNISNKRTTGNIITILDRAIVV